MNQKGKSKGRVTFENQSEPKILNTDERLKDLVEYQKKKKFSVSKRSKLKDVPDQMEKVQSDNEDAGIVSVE